MASKLAFIDDRLATDRQGLRKAVKCQRCGLNGGHTCSSVADGLICCVGKFGLMSIKSKTGERGSNVGT
jgi:hypothetical protein